MDGCNHRKGRGKVGCAGVATMMVERPYAGQAVCCNKGEATRIVATMEKGAGRSGALVLQQRWWKGRT